MLVKYIHIYTLIGKQRLCILGLRCTNWYERWMEIYRIEMSLLAQ